MELINEIDQTFIYNKKIVRIFGTTDKPLFIAKDVCDILELTNITVSLKYLPNKWKSQIEVGGNINGIKSMNAINEAGLYMLILKSKKQIAKKFQEWVCNEVLPSIRKKGEFILESYKKQLEEKDKELKNIEFEKNKLFWLIQRNKRFHSYYKFNKGSCFYIITDIEYEKCSCDKKTRFKVGVEGVNINVRLQEHRTSMPGCKLLYLIYTKDNEMLEKTILRKYKDKRTGEWLVGIDLEIIINDISHFLSFIDSLHTVEKELDKYNVLIENISESVENRTLYKDYILEEDEDSLTEIEEVIEEKVIEEKVVKEKVVEEKVVEEKQDTKKICINCNLSKSLNSFRKTGNKTGSLYRKSCLDCDQKIEKKCKKCNISKCVSFFRKIGFGHQKECLDCEKASFESTKIQYKDIEIKDDINIEECKECKKCNKILTLKLFYKTKYIKDGHEIYCKNCIAKCKNKTDKRIKIKPDNIPNDCAFCCKCEEIKHQSFFRKNKTHTNGCQSFCKPCENSIRSVNRRKKRIENSV